MVITTQSVKASGTAFTLTTSANTAFVLGTTSPTLTITNTGTYQIFASVKVNSNSATTTSGGEQLVNFNVRRTNGTPANLGETGTIYIPGNLTASIFGDVRGILVPDQAMTAGDVIVISGKITGLPDSGAMTIPQATLLAVQTA